MQLMWLCCKCGRAGMWRSWGYVVCVGCVVECYEDVLW